MDVNFDKDDLKSVLYYLKDTYGMRCFKDRRFIWMIENLMPDREKYIGLDNLDYDGTLMKIINNISSDLQKKIKIIEEAREYNFKLHLDKDGGQLSILTDVIDYFSNNHSVEEELTESELKPYFDELLAKLETDYRYFIDNYKEIVDPIGTDGPCVIRGGSAFETPDYCRCARRNSAFSGTVAQYIGFRAALTPVHNHSGKKF